MLAFSSGVSSFAGSGPDPYRIRVNPPSEAWNIIPLVTAYQQQTPPARLAALDNADRDSLTHGVAVGFVQKVAEDSELAPKSAGVEISRILIEVPYAEFIEKFPVDSWGSRLAHYLGGQVEVMERDSEGRPIRQVERMVLSALPGDGDADAFNQDMTKAEEIVYGSNHATVYWRVFHSDNHSTVMDLGSVEFAAYDAGSVLVTFHSAHRLRALGLPLWPALTTGMLKKTFLDHLRNYQKLFP